MRIVFLMLIVTICDLGNCAFSQSKYPTAEIEPLYDLNFTRAERDSLLSGLQDYQKAFQALHKVSISNTVPMSLVFNPLPTGLQYTPQQKQNDWGLPKDVVLPADRNQLAFYPVYKLAVLLRARKVTSLELTKIYLSRIKKYADTLQCAISILESNALQQAQRADDEIKRGKYRGPLHGIPYGIKDLLSVEGTETTWGAAPYRGQNINETATIVKKLEQAGAVLVVKLTLGALAMGDIWYGGVTKNPWNLKEGSSGSSAGSASATVAGLVAFAIGTETLGSIVSPSTRCGASGMRPTYGAVSRHGAMALSWSMDKIGPICRSALDCALVYDVIRGEDAFDRATRNAAFNYDAKTPLKKLKVAYFKNLFDSKYATRENDQKALEVLKSLGVELIPLDWDTKIPVAAVRLMLTAEAAASFDELTRSNRDSLLTDQRKWAWPNTFRTARFIPAVEYINASRVRQQLIDEFYQKIKDVDVVVTPSFAGTQLLTTNLTGNPCVVVPNGFNEKGSPTSISFIGKLFDEGNLIAVARAYQEASEWEDKVPPLFKD
ncbi:MAG: amidase [Bacteroidota bacterium]|jgi:Asp-tRNA(Asn)/Glu-tRNA(Gln) amidotransferase A subunit family amidase|nr:amidase [Cytophagales bacterium]MCE2958349.1 amidase [Flammeovirgaceae bacterium]